MTKQEEMLMEQGLDCSMCGCKEKYRTWWTCLTCGSMGCYNHQYFNGYTVRYCVVCCPQKLGLIKGEKCND